MSLFSAINTSLSGLQAVTTQMQIVANNIANAGQEGFTRKSTIQSPTVLSGEGGGVQISGFVRATDPALTASIHTASSDAGMRTTQDRYLQQVQTILGATNGNNPPLTEAMAQFAASWRQLAAAPESNVRQNQVVQTASNLVATLRSISGAVESLDRQARAEVNSTLTDLNSDLQGIVDLNQKITAAIAAGQSPSNLEDARDQLIQKVSEVMNVTVLPRNQGQIALYTTGGYALLDGPAQSFSYDGATVTSALDPSMSLNDVLTGGKLEALVNFRADSSPTSPSVDPAAEVIRKLRSQLDLVASALTTSSAGPPETFAYAYANATTGTGEATSIFSGSTRTTLAVNANLLDGSETIKIASASDVADTFNDSSRSFTADGLSITGASYETMTASIMTFFQQSASTAAQLSATSSQQQDYLKQRLANQTGVNVDTETVALTTLQNAYSASAHVIAVIQQMFAALEAIA